MTKSCVHYFPKWLLQESFQMEYSPKHGFRVKLFDGTEFFEESRRSVAEAAAKTNLKRQISRIGGKPIRRAQSKLSQQDRVDIRALALGGVSLHEMSLMFGKCKSTISQVVRGLR